MKSSKQLFNKRTLAIAISSVLAGYSSFTLAECSTTPVSPNSGNIKPGSDICVTDQNGLVAKENTEYAWLDTNGKNITVEGAGSAILIGEGATITRKFKMYGSTVTTENGTAIDIKNGAIIKEGMDIQGSVISSSNGSAIAIDGADIDGGIKITKGSQVSGTNGSAISIKSSNVSGSITIDDSQIESSGATAVDLNGATVSGGVKIQNGSQVISDGDAIHLKDSTISNGGLTVYKASVSSISGTAINVDVSTITGDLKIQGGSEVSSIDGDAIAVKNGSTINGSLLLDSGVTVSSENGTAISIENASDITGSIKVQGNSVVQSTNGNAIHIQSGLLKIDGLVIQTGSSVQSTNGTAILIGSGTVIEKDGFKIYDSSVHSVNGDAIVIADGATIDNLTIAKAGSIVSSENGTAIVIDGQAMDGGAINLKIAEGATVSGGEAAIDFSGADSVVKLDIIDGTITGDIIGNTTHNNGSAGNRINFKGNSVFDGNSISGVGWIENSGYLSVHGQQQTVVWDTDTFANKANSTLNFVVGEETNLDETLLQVTGDAKFETGSSVGLTYKGADINDIIGQQITVLEADTIDGGENIAYELEDSLSPLLTGKSEEIAKIGLNGEVIGSEIIVEVGVTLDAEMGAQQFGELVEGGGGSAQDITASEYIVKSALTQFNEGQGITPEQADDEIAALNSNSNPAGELVALLASSGSDAALTAALANELTPDAEGGEVRSALAITDQMRRGSGLRSDYLRNQAWLGNSHDSWNGWTQVLYSDGELDNSSKANGYEMSMLGASFGIDHVMDNNKFLGLSFGMANADIDIGGSQNTKDVTSYQAMGYAGWFNNRFFLDGNFSLAFNNNESTRYVGASTGYEGNQQASAEYSSHQMGYQLAAGMKFDVAGVHIKPKLSYGLQWIQVEEFQETGSPAALRYEQQKYTVMELGAGLSASYNIPVEIGVVTPSFTVMGYKDLSNDEFIKENAGLVSDTSDEGFIMTGDTVGDDSVYAHLGADLEMISGINVGGGLQYYQRGDYRDYALTANMNWRF